MVLSKGIATIDTEFSTGDVPGGITQKEGDCTHEVFGSPHLANRNERSPLIAEVGILIQDLAGSIIITN